MFSYFDIIIQWQCNNYVEQHLFYKSNNNENNNNNNNNNSYNKPGMIVGFQGYFSRHNNAGKIARKIIDSNTFNATAILHNMNKAKFMSAENISDILMMIIFEYFQNSTPFLKYFQKHCLFLMQISE